MPKPKIAPDLSLPEAEITLACLQDAIDTKSHRLDSPARWKAARRAEEKLIAVLNAALEAEGSRRV